MLEIKIKKEDPKKEESDIICPICKKNIGKYDLLIEVRINNGFLWKDLNSSAFKICLNCLNKEDKIREFSAKEIIVP